MSRVHSVAVEIPCVYLSFLGYAAASFLPCRVQGMEATTTINTHLLYNLVCMSSYHYYVGRYLS